jgi:hypothetical protein
LDIQDRTGNPETLATLDIQDRTKTNKTQNKCNTTHKTTISKMDPIKTQG